MTHKTSHQGFSKADTWNVTNSMLCSWLLNVTDPELCLNVAYIDTTREIQEGLQKRYLVAKLPKIHQPKTAIANRKQGNLDVEDF